MWDPVPSSDASYETVHGGEDGRLSSDEATLNGHRQSDELSLSPEELAFSDPMDEKAHHFALSNDDTSPPWSPRWTKFKHSLLQLVDRGRSSLQEEAVVESTALDEEEARLGLMAGAESSPRWARVASSAVSSTRYWLVFPLPSYFHHFFLPDSGKVEVTRPTDYLDGLRGVASLFVFFDHYLVGFHDELLQYSYGEGDHWNFLQLPFIRTAYAGSAMVSIFFVISGYVLSQRCIVAMRNNQHDKVYSILTSTTFRRGMRLYLPSLIASACCFVAIVLGFLPSQIPHHWSVWREMHNFIDFVNDFLFKFWAWDINFNGYYAPQLWTIPLEYKCSMILFMQILVVSRCTSFVRLALQVMTILYLFYADRWDVATFISGMLIAELNVIADERRKKTVEARGPNQLASRSLVQRSRDCFSSFLVKLPLWIILIAGWYLTGFPGSDAEHTPGYGWLTHFWRGDWDYKFRFWIAVAAILIIFATSFLRPAQAFFTTSIARYLGKISYALYLVHALMNRTLRLYIWHTFWKVLQWESEEGDDAKLEGGWFMGTIIYIPMVLWVADIFWRLVDIPMVKVAKWVESKCFVKTH